MVAPLGGVAPEATTPGLQFRLFSEGNAEITARSFVDVRPTRVEWLPPPKGSRATTRARVAAALRGNPATGPSANGFLSG